MSKSLGYNIIAIRKQLMGIAPPIKEMWGKSICVIYFTHCINETILWSGNNYADNISEEIFNSWRTNKNKIEFYSVGLYGFLSAIQN
jgi:hypothetical protein